jgi:hypothetical protein
MGFYNDIVLPRLIGLAMRKEDLVGYRQRVIGARRAESWRSASARGSTCRSMARR